MLKLLASVLTLGALSFGCAATRTKGWSESPHPEASGPARFRVLTLNTAHGVRQPALSFLANRGVVEGNLQAMARALSREDADVVALQEVHARRHRGEPLDQLEVLAAHSGYGHSYFGTHYERPKLEARRGTALLSKTELTSPRSTAFNVAPGDDHGWVVATIRPEGMMGVEIDVVSVHLDPFSPGKRVEQMDALVEVFEDRARPLVVMGDFNADWGGRDGVERLATRLGLRAFQPTNGERTFPSQLPMIRVDWILVSPELRILRHRTFREPATDHLGVVADLGLSPRVWARLQGQQTRVQMAQAALEREVPAVAVGGAGAPVIAPAAVIATPANGPERGLARVEEFSLAEEGVAAKAPSVAERRPARRSTSKLTARAEASGAVRGDVEAHAPRPKEFPSDGAASTSVSVAPARKEFAPTPSTSRREPAARRSARRRATPISRTLAPGTEVANVDLPRSRPAAKGDIEDVPDAAPGRR